ncbi:sensor histidine kinase [Lachnospiraceae bacterium CLA-AA-H246]|uniref:histidine kinase n=1 Tax=Hominisplanchenecus faecis TaxID=2885351 RepID=A0ABS8EX06_9FIRM|nr:sensor histidine kinase [Hominisplanchenecus faecis]MCC2148684.1 sensor histidine kinase [Hominisplanchenecus faecis]
MIKKLRRKFVIINMSLVAVILCVVLGMFCFTRVHAFRAESEIVIRHSVHNIGKAIPEEDLPHLFERFYRTDKSRARTDGGYGLGLAIAQTIAKNHRAKITVVSAKNLGTSFTVTFPVSKEKESA